MQSYQYEKPDNLVDLWEESAAKYGDRKLFGTKNKSGAYEWVTFREVDTRISNLRGGLAQLGIGQGDTVGIIANNRVEWAVAAFATYGLLGRFVPMYEAELVQTWKYIINDSGIKILFVSKPEIYEKIKDFPKEIPALKHIFVIDETGDRSMSALEKKGQAHPVASRKPSPEDISVLIYTSGTTGNPKGVLLSHGNFSSNTLAGLKSYPELKEPGTVTLAILPWAHSFGQTAELYAIPYIGGSVGLAENATTIANDIGLVKPTFLIAVPRVFNRIYNGLWAKMNAEGGLPKALFVMGVNAAKRKRELAAKGQSEFMTNLKFKLADKIVFKKIRDRLGGRLKGSISGSAAMSPDIAQFFFDLGVPIYDCYGLTETSPAVTMNCSFDYRMGSVGRPISGVKVVIDKSMSEPGATDGEIVVYGPNVMKGYHNKPEETNKVMTQDGGLRTGDRGRLDEDGYLYITGRIKEQYKLENGKFCFPAALEEAIGLVPIVQQAVIYGENRSFNVCFIVPDFDALRNLAKEKGWPEDNPGLVEHKGAAELVGQLITDSLRNKFGGYEIPKKFVLLPEPFSIENGMLTQTMKLKRNLVVAKLKDKIEALYRE